jgi:hypothetical protein
MLKDIVEVEPTRDYRLRLRFEDGVEGEVNLAEMVRFEGVFAPLKDRSEFLKVAVNPELGTICWPNGADLDPDVLYAKVTGEEISVSPQQESRNITVGSAEADWQPRSSSKRMRSTPLAGWVDTRGPLIATYDCDGQPTG